MADSQDSAVKMEEFIEQLHGTGTQTVCFFGLMSALQNRKIEKRAKAADLKKMQKKILPLGSPKFDAVINTGERNLNLPDGRRMLWCYGRKQGSRY